MKVIKEAVAEGNIRVPEEDLKKINLFTKKELKAEDIFTFDMILCDNKVDRDYECFTTESLKTLEKLFTGKTGIFDHTWSAAGQKARIYKTEVVSHGEEKSAEGGDYAYLKGSAYMLKTETNSELISEIEGGIKREVSIGCSVKKSTCSICGELSGSGKCGHVKGREYGGRLCYTRLEEPVDAYEWSFVAVPAQKNAGVIKKFGQGEENMSLEEYVRKAGAVQYSEELEKLKSRASLGEAYLKSLRGEVVRLGALTGMGVDSEILKSAAEKMEEKELLEFKKAFEEKLDEMFPPICQLEAAKAVKQDFDGREFLI